MKSLINHITCVVFSSIAYAEELEEHKTLFKILITDRLYTYLLVGMCTFAFIVSITEMKRDKKKVEIDQLKFDLKNELQSIDNLALIK